MMDHLFSVWQSEMYLRSYPFVHEFLFSLKSFIIWWNTKSKTLSIKLTCWNFNEWWECEWVVMVIWSYMLNRGETSVYVRWILLGVLVDGTSLYCLLAEVSNYFLGLPSITVVDKHLTWAYIVYWFLNTLKKKITSLNSCCFCSFFEAFGNTSSSS